MAALDLWSVLSDRMNAGAAFKLVHRETTGFELLKVLIGHVTIIQCCFSQVLIAVGQLRRNSQVLSVQVIVDRGERINPRRSSRPAAGAPPRARSLDAVIPMHLTPPSHLGIVS